MQSSHRQASGDPGASEPPKTTLPPEKIFPIQIGCELFRLSGASIASDAPSYFSHFFEEQVRQNGEAGNIRTLYIDRDPVTFQTIARHLQGYHVRPQDGLDFVKLFADAQFYSLPRLISQLFESEIFVQIGDRHFQIPRDIFSSPGDSPNFFTLGFAVFFMSPSEVFPGLDRKGLLRPPPLMPPSVPNRSGEVFAELIHLLRGYPVHIRSEEHRAELLRDCRYFHLRGLEQKLIPHHISQNPLRGRSEIVIRLEDIRQSGLHIADGVEQFTREPEMTGGGGLIVYSRPFVDEVSYDLVLEIGNESTLIYRDAMQAEFLGLSKARVSSFAQVLASKMALSRDDALLDKGRVEICIDHDADLIVDGEQSSADCLLLTFDPSAPVQYHAAQYPPAKRRRSDGDAGDEMACWIARTGQWRVCVRPIQKSKASSSREYELLFTAVKLDIYTDQRRRNRTRGFLG